MTVAPNTWQVDSEHSTIRFSIRHMVVAKVRGRFARWKGTLRTQDEDFGRASVEVVIDASSLETGTPERDTYLKSAAFLDVAAHPEITFKSKRVEKLGADRLRVVGDLTIRDVAREVVLDVKSSGRTRQHVMFTATTSIDRKNFGLVWNELVEAGGLAVGDRVDIDLEVEAVPS